MVDYVNGENMDCINPELSFTPERRRLEHKLVKEAKKALMNIDIPEEERKIMNTMWEDYILEYEHEYKRYHKDEIYKSLSLLN